jgi:hypothetical protein
MGKGENCKIGRVNKGHGTVIGEKSRKQIKVWNE